MHASWQSHNGLINNRPSWRQWASFGLMQALWFGFGLRGLWRVKENHLFWCAFFSHVSDMHALSGFLRARCFSLSVCSTCCQTDGDWSEGSLLCFHKTNLTAFYQLNLFLLFFLIKCYHLQAQSCLNSDLYWSWQSYHFRNWCGWENKMRD